MTNHRGEPHPTFADCILILIQKKDSILLSKILIGNKVYNTEISVGSRKVFEQLAQDFIGASVEGCGVPTTISDMI